MKTQRLALRKPAAHIEVTPETLTILADAFGVPTVCPEVPGWAKICTPRGYYCAWFKHAPR